MAGGCLGRTKKPSGTGGFVRRSGEMGEKDGHYFASREQSEREMSRNAANDVVAATHAEMADRYEALAAVFGAKRLDDVPADYLGSEPYR